MFKLILGNCQLWHKFLVSYTKIPCKQLLRNYQNMDHGSKKLLPRCDFSFIVAISMWLWNIRRVWTNESQSWIFFFSIFPIDIDIHSYFILYWYWYTLLLQYQVQRTRRTISLVNYRPYFPIWTVVKMGYEMLLKSFVALCVSLFHCVLCISDNE